LGTTSAAAPTATRDVSVSGELAPPAALANFTTLRRRETKPAAARRTQAPRGPIKIMFIPANMRGATDQSP
jgi:hypothetical protein